MDEAKEVLRKYARRRKASAPKEGMCEAEQRWRAKLATDMKRRALLVGGAELLKSWLSERYGCSAPDDLDSNSLAAAWQEVMQWTSPIG